MIFFAKNSTTKKCLREIGRKNPSQIVVCLAMCETASNVSLICILIIFFSVWFFFAHMLESTNTAAIQSFRSFYFRRTLIQLCVDNEKHRFVVVKNAAPKKSLRRGREASQKSKVRVESKNLAVEEIRSK
jgi:hypothetical protein